MVYTGEAPGYGMAGNLLIAIGFSFALLSAFANYFAFRRPGEEYAWKRMARWSFLIHAGSVVGIFVLIYYLIFNHRFEYYYVWEHSSKALPWKYILAGFWEGQEGSFLLWTFWHVVLGGILIRKGGTWEAPVMTTISLVQAFLMSMVLGISILGNKIGTNPFVLLREHPDMANLPFVKMSDYLQRIDDGRGLNPLLQNYWMVIHPPVLFLGFASTVVPFAFAMAGLMTGKITEWCRVAIPWAFFGIATLGTGILMGAAWAYEALSFGGFWAWDPVENASLVPWLTFVGAGHVMMIYRKNGTSLISCFLLSIVTFILVLYSTFLTRSGILGDTSVHAFTDLGMTGQLVIYMVFFLVMAAFLMFRNRKNFPPLSQHEDSMFSREFWMFIGMMVLVISSLHITFTTSKPVINKLFGTSLAPPEHPIAYYNSWQVPFAVIVCLLIAVGQFFKYRNTAPSAFWKQITYSLVISVIVTSVAAWFIQFERVQFILLLFASLFAFFANMDYALRILKGRMDHTGGSIAHTGIALIMLGSLISNGKSHVISKNMLNVDLGKEFPNNENIMLLKNDTLQMADYFVTFKGSEQKGVHIYYEIEYLRTDNTNGRLEHAFTLKPLIQLNPRMGNVSEPATKHFPDRDIYTHITYADLEHLDKQDDANAFMDPVMHAMAVGDTVTTSNALVVLEGLSQQIDRKALGLGPNDIGVGAVLSITDINKQRHSAFPLFLVRDKMIFTKEVPVEALGLKFAFRKINPESGKIDLAISEKKANKREFVIMKAVVFPYINILWTGCILMITGSVMAIRKRIADSKRTMAKSPPVP